MPSIAEAVQAATRMSPDKFEPVTHITVPQERVPVFGDEGDSEPNFNHFLRCPIPPLNVSTDSLRQFYRRGIPQYRSLPLQSQNTN